MKIRAKLVELNKTNLDVVKELHNRGIHADPSEFSKAINKKRLTRKSDEIVAETLKIIEEWEQDGTVS